MTVGVGNTLFERFEVGGLRKNNFLNEFDKITVDCAHLANNAQIRRYTLINVQNFVTYRSLRKY